ncbi:AI-2E family transporter [Blastococcus brunescens]|uniref:AI-2E family transporter n=1 Tax=Blastococcus brunescens TaxID=1564165 RepID=A0ABZ1B2Q5_9ACTN|nr:AI-2E family transporter [Blastococcus sp. BMG 8361]WRL63325.1 AI-2E family transporter [Blastococcus sp. BMG 8361]
MRRRARDLTARARARIRAAREHDPHAWDDIPDADRAVLLHYGAMPDDATSDRHVATDTAPHDDDPTPPPLGSPEPGAPDLDGAVGPGGVSGPPEGGRPQRPGEPRQLLTADPRRTGRSRLSAENEVPNGLRIAAAWSWRLIVVLGGIYALLYAAASIAVVVVPVIVALLLAALLQPGAASLVRRGWPPSLAALVMLLVGLAVVSGIITLVVERFIADYDNLAGQVSEGIGQVQDFVVRTFPITQGQLEDAVATLQETLLDNQETLATGALTTATTVGEVFTGLVLALFTLFFFLKDGRTIWLWLVGLFPTGSRAYVDEAARRSWRTLISYVRATAAVAMVDAVGIGIGLAVLGVPLVVPLAALVFLGAFIPIIGGFLAGTIAVLVALVSNGPITALITLAVVVGVMQLEGHVLQPLLLGRAVRVHPLAVVLAIGAGLLIAGIFGALIAVPIVACANVAGTYLSRRHHGPRPPEPRPDRARPRSPPADATDGSGRAAHTGRLPRRPPLLGRWRSLRCSPGCQPTVIRPSTAASAMSVRQCASANRTPATRS